MIGEKEETEVKVMHEVQKGNGDVVFHTFMTKDEAYGAGRTFARVEFLPGTSIGVHEHHGEFEGYYVLKGQALVTDNGTESILNPGITICVRTGTAMALHVMVRNPWKSLH